MLLQRQRWADDISAGTWTGMAQALHMQTEHSSLRLTLVKHEVFWKPGIGLSCWSWYNIQCLVLHLTIYIVLFLPFLVVPTAHTCVEIDLLLCKFDKNSISIFLKITKSEAEPPSVDCGSNADDTYPPRCVLDIIPLRVPKRAELNCTLEVMGIEEHGRSFILRSPSVVSPKVSRRMTQELNGKKGTSYYPQVWCVQTLQRHSLYIDTDKNREKRRMTSSLLSQ